MPAKNGRPFPENYLFKYGPVISYLVISLVLVENLLGLGILLEVQWQHIVLIGGLLLIPFLREIDQVFIPNVGGVQMNQTLEWKETMQEVLDDAGLESVPQSETDEGSPEEIEESAEDNQRVKENHTLGGDVTEIANEIYSLADDDPRLAIAKLGMELEHGLRHLIHAKGQTPGMQFQKMLDQLRDDPDIDARFIGIAQEIRQARNKAVHSSEFDPEKAAGLIDIGIDLLKYINNVTKSGKIPESEPPARR